MRAGGLLAAPPPTPPALQAELNSRARCPEASIELALLCNGGGANPSPQRRRVVRALGALPHGAVTDVAWLSLGWGIARVSGLRAAQAGKTAGGSSVMRSAEKVAGRMAQRSREAAAGARGPPPVALARPRERRRIDSRGDQTCGRRATTTHGAGRSHPTPRRTSSAHQHTHRGDAPGGSRAGSGRRAGRVLRWPRRAGSGARHRQGDRLPDHR